MPCRGRAIEVEPLEPRTLFSAGHVDRYFASNGELSFPRQTEGVDSLVGFVGVLPNGRFLAIQYDTTSSDDKVTLMRFRSDGSLDRTFGTRGKVTDTFGDDAYGILEPDGKVLLFEFDAYKGSRVIRYSADGQLDPTFGQGGVATFDKVSLGGAVLQYDGKIVFATTEIPFNAPRMIRLTRLNADGSFDSTFGDHGVARFDDPSAPASIKQGDDGYQPATALAIDRDGSIIVGGAWQDISEISQFPEIPNDVTILSKSSVVLTRVSASGALVAQKELKLDLHEYYEEGSTFLSHLSVLPDGNILAVAQHNGRGGVLRIHHDFSLDPTFGIIGDGSASIPVAGVTLRSLAVQSDGRILVTGESAVGVNSNLVVIGRLMPDGALDSTFGEQGVTTAATDESATLTSPHVAPDGSIYALQSGDGSNSILRYWSESGPAAQLWFKRTGEPVAGAQTFLFGVTYRDDHGIDLASLDAFDIRIDLPDGTTRKARPVTITPAADGQVYVLYKFSAPHGTFSAADNGRYLVKVRTHQVADVDGHFAQTRTLGSFRIALPEKTSPLAKADDGRSVVPVWSQATPSEFERSLILGLDEGGNLI